MDSGFLGTQFFFSVAAAHCVDKRQFYRIVNFSSLDTFLFELKGQSIDSESVNLPGMLPGHYCSKHPSKNPSFFGKNVCQNYSVSVSAEGSRRLDNSQKN